MLETQRYLQTHSLQELVDNYHVRYCQSYKYPELYLFSYNLYDSPDFSQKIVRECRGLILNSRSNWKPVVQAYEKFFNLGEPLCPKDLNYTNYKIYPKLDGSICTLYNYSGNWEVASSGKPHAEGEVIKGMTYAELFWEVFKLKNYPLPLNRKEVYIFELMHPYNTGTLPVFSEKPELVLHGIRDMKKLQEVNLDHRATPYKKVSPISIPFENLMKEVREGEGHEGYVLVSPDFHRVKLKLDWYIDRHHQISHIPVDSRILHHFINETEDDYISKFPDSVTKFEFLKEQYNIYMSQIHRVTRVIRDLFPDMTDQNKKDVVVLLFKKCKQEWLIHGVLNALSDKISSRRMFEDLYVLDADYGNESPQG